MNSLPPKPSLYWPLSTILVSLAGVLFNFVAAFIPGGWGFWSNMVFVAMGMTGAMIGYSSHEDALQKRKEWRTLKFETWLAEPWPELPEQEPWPEIERAMGALLEVGVDPTYERAKDFLTCERAKDLKRSCRHSQIERFTVDQQDEDMAICVDCGRPVDESTHETRMRALRNPLLFFSSPRDLDYIERALIEQRKRGLAGN